MDQVTADDGVASSNPTAVFVENKESSQDQNIKTDSEKQASKSQSPSDEEEGEEIKMQFEVTRPQRNEQQKKEAG